MIGQNRTQYSIIEVVTKLVLHPYFIKNPPFYGNTSPFSIHFDENAPTDYLAPCYHGCKLMQPLSNINEHNNQIKQK